MHVDVFVDQQKAFDTVNREIILQKLKHYDFRNVTYLWFKSYLNNRKQLVSLNYVESEPKSCNKEFLKGQC